jgi:hypothetical protein
MLRSLKKVLPALFEPQLTPSLYTVARKVEDCHVKIIDTQVFNATALAFEVTKPAVEAPFQA